MDFVKEKKHCKNCGASEQINRKFKLKENSLLCARNRFFYLTKI